MHLQHGCVSVRREVKDMKSAASGNSGSGVGDAVACGKAHVAWGCSVTTYPTYLSIGAWT